METCIYKGFVTHRRFKPVRHYFSYKIDDEFKRKNLERAMVMINEMYNNNTKIFSMYNENWYYRKWFCR